MIELLLQAERALSVGLLDRADVLYGQVARADPRNSIAVVGLARVTLDRGDDIGALALARKALAIDPENTAAQRMVARLEEVLDFRDAARDLDLEPAADVMEADATVEVGAAATALEASDVEPASVPGQAAAPASVEAETALEPQPAPPLDPIGTEINEPIEARVHAALEAPATLPEASAAAPEAEPAEMTDPDPDPERAPVPAPIEPRRRSWLDRLFGRP